MPREDEGPYQAEGVRCPSVLPDTPRQAGRSHEGDPTGEAKTQPASSSGQGQEHGLAQGVQLGGPQQGWALGLPRTSTSRPGQKKEGRGHISEELLPEARKQAARLRTGNAPRMRRA